MMGKYNPIQMNTAPVRMKLLLKDDVPIGQGPTRISHEEQKIIDSLVTEWLKQGIMVPSSSEYAPPIVLVPKNQSGYVATKESSMKKFA